MNKTTKHIDDTLLTKFLLGEATFAEQETVAEWLENSEENQAYFESFATIWQNSTTDETKRANPNTAWEKMEKQIHTPTYRIILPYVGAIAAILIVAFFIFSPEKYDTTTFTAKNKSLKEILPDGTEVILSGNSQINYFFNTKTRTRTARLEGEAFFHVKRDTTQKFVVETLYGKVEVLGTQFNVNIVKNDGVYVNVLSGVVKLSKEEVNSLVLQKGESGFIPAADKQISEITQKPAEFFSINKTLIFNNMPLKDVFANLEHCYSTKINVDTKVNVNSLFTSQFNNDSVNEILNVITQTYGLKFNKLNNEYSIALESEN
nr:FecR domain-containing protein [uncultured Draconibacterium sp.]